MIARTLRLAAMLLTLAAFMPSTASAASGSQADLPLQALGFTSQTLTGRSVSADFFLPGQGDYVLAPQGNAVDLAIGGSELLDPTSVVTVLWNGVPLGDRPAPTVEAAQTWQFTLDPASVDPNVNHLQVVGALRLRNETCGDDQNPGRHITIYGQTALRLAYIDNTPHPPPLTPDLSRYPWPFFEASTVAPPELTFVLPAQPDSAELS
ncbi:MAG: cellulose biosynthesis cyclic di-GMP-binding regulatory protein BcsB, partial [Chloroflexi bacterium]|nr:cellulose biosynthesis cyclic di-GMP-binding regulatory protein BcsB [Chloroflexota bacterium]